MPSKSSLLDVLPVHCWSRVQKCLHQPLPDLPTCRCRPESSLPAMYKRRC